MPLDDRDDDGEDAKTSSTRARQALLTWMVRVVGLSLLAFLPVLGAEFVNFDDHTNFHENPIFKTSLARQLAWSWTTLHLGTFQPLGWHLIALEHALWDFHPMGYHAVSLLLHGAIVAAVLLLTVEVVRRARPSLFDRSPSRCVALCAASVLLFAVHPLRAEPVAWISAQPYMPSALMAILSTWVYVRARPESPDAPTSRRLLIAASLMAGLAMAFKGLVSTVPAWWLVLDFAPLGRFRRGPGVRRSVLSRLITAVVEKLPVFAMSAVSLAINRHAKNADFFESGEPLHGTFVANLCDASRAVWFYGVKTLAPLDLTVNYPRPPAIDVDPARPIYAASLAALAIVCSLAWLGRRRWPSFSAAWAAYLVILLPTSGIIRFSPEIASDRYSYLATIPWVMLVAGGLLGLADCRPKAVRWVAAAVAPLVLVLIGMSWHQSATWRHSIALWEHALASGAGESLQTRGNYARVLAVVNMPEEQEEQLREAIRVAPLSAKASMNYGVFLANHGREDRAELYYRRALQITPKYPCARMNLGILLAWADPIEEVKRALEEPSVWPMPPSPRWVEAADHLLRAVSMEPDLDQARLHLGGLCVRTGRVDEARTLLQRAAMSRPSDPDPHAWLALAAVRYGDRDQAATELAEAVRLHPNPEASVLLDRIHATTTTTPVSKHAPTTVASSR